ncbi:hypothetical protein BCEP4_180011 [Burkholderia cepacia]|nr:hypothetical protein BCEP4_180011 [Burkholderia cepacia]
MPFHPPIKLPMSSKFPKIASFNPESNICKEHWNPPS